ncbi:MAG TPA: hypothetical protein VGL72_06045 [Bryobacteraceae bacterium]|jgi:hypothetical protein
MRKFPELFSDILIMENRWPRKGDRLLRTSDDWQTAATFAPHQISRDAFLWDGYMDAGAALIDEAERRPHQRFTLIYPILFNYRHGLETAMKWTIGMYGGPGHVTLDELDHDLWSLWKKCRAILESVPCPDGEEALNAVEQIVKDFHDLDKNAMAFRYSTNRNGRTILLPDKPVDLQNVQHVMEAVDNFFKGADGMLSDILSGAPNYF